MLSCHIFIRFFHNFSRFLHFFSRQNFLQKPFKNSVVHHSPVASHTLLIESQVAVGRGGVSQRPTSTMRQLVVFVAYQYKVYPLPGCHYPDFHIDAHRGEVGLDDLNHTQICGRIHHNIGCKSIGITGFRQQFFRCRWIIGIFIFQILRPFFVRESPTGHITGC